jgi:hypothetical protein
VWRSRVEQSKLHIEICSAGLQHSGVELRILQRGVNSVLIGQECDALFFFLLHHTTFCGMNIVAARTVCGCLLSNALGG